MFLFCASVFQNYCHDNNNATYQNGDSNYPNRKSSGRGGSGEVYCFHASGRTNICAPTICLVGSFEIYCSLRNISCYLAVRVGGAQKRALGAFEYTVVDTLVGERGSL